MIALLGGGQPTTSQDPVGWFLARARWAKGIATQHGTWGAKWLYRTKTWYQHLLRHHVPTNLASAILKFHDFEWLKAQRLRANSACILAGRTDTRVLRSKVHARFDESVISFNIDGSKKPKKKPWLKF
eukprot:5422904-Karenia_brevis.AAC.1